MTESLDEADVVLLNTCAIRESAQSRIYGRLGHLHEIKQRNPRLIVGLLGCMAQSLKQELLQKNGRYASLYKLQTHVAAEAE